MISNNMSITTPGTSDQHAAGVVCLLADAMRGAAGAGAAGEC